MERLQIKAYSSLYEYLLCNGRRIWRIWRQTSEFCYTDKEMVGIKGHHSVGGFRASCYNAMPVESVQALIDCMQEFEKMH